MFSPITVGLLGPQGFPLRAWIVRPDIHWPGSVGRSVLEVVHFHQPNRVQTPRRKSRIKELYKKKVEFYRSGFEIYSLDEILRRRKLANIKRKALEVDFFEDFEFDVDEIDEDVEENAEEDFY